MHEPKRGLQEPNVVVILGIGTDDDEATAIERSQKFIGRITHPRAFVGAVTCRIYKTRAVVRLPPHDIFSFFMTTITETNLVGLEV